MRALAFVLYGLVCLAAGAALGWYARGPGVMLPAAGTFGPVPLVSQSPARTMVVHIGPSVGAAPTGNVAASPVALPSVIARPPNAPPEILSISISSPVVTGGQIVTGTVKTSSNVASVEARMGGYSSALAKTGVGEFALSYRVPELPPILRRTYQIQVIARNTNGDAVTSSLPITIR